MLTRVAGLKPHNVLDQHKLWGALQAREVHEEGGKGARARVQGVLLVALPCVGLAGWGQEPAVCTQLVQLLLCQGLDVALRGPPVRTSQARAPGWFSPKNRCGHTACTRWQQQQWWTQLGVCVVWQDYFALCAGARFGGNCLVLRVVQVDACVWTDLLKLRVAVRANNMDAWPLAAMPACTPT